MKLYTNQSNDIPICELKTFVIKLANTQKYFLKKIYKQGHKIKKLSNCIAGKKKTIKKRGQPI